MDLQGWRLRLSGIKDTFANTTRSLKGRWGAHREHGHPGDQNHHNHHHREDRGATPPATPSTSSSAAAHVNDAPQNAAL
jgi:hypothetical protein